MTLLVIEPHTSDYPQTDPVDSAFDGSAFDWDSPAAAEPAAPLLSPEQKAQLLAHLSWQHGGKLALLWLVLVALAFTQIVQLRFSHNPLNWMPDKLPIVQATRTIDERLSGTMTLDHVFDTGVKDLVFMQVLAQWRDRLDQQAVRGVEVAASQSIVNLVRDTHRALQGGGDDQYRLSDTQAFMNEALFLFETSAADQLYNLVDTQYQTTRMTPILPWRDILHYQAFIEQLRDEGENRFAGLAEVQVSGLIALLAGTLQAVLTITATSYALAAIVISLMMIALLGSIRLGLLTMLPNLAPILVVMGLMLPFGIALDMITMLVATIAIGKTSWAGKPSTIPELKLIRMQNVPTVAGAATAFTGSHG